MLSPPRQSPAACYFSPPCSLQPSFLDSASEKISPPGRVSPRRFHCVGRVRKVSGPTQPAPCTLACTVQLIRKYITSSLLLKLLEDISNSLNYPDCKSRNFRNLLKLFHQNMSKNLQSFNKYQNIFRVV